MAASQLELTQRAREVDTLAKVGHQLPLKQRAVTEARLGPGRVMKMSRVRGSGREMIENSSLNQHFSEFLPASSGLSVPAAAGVPAALEAGVVSHAAEAEVNLPDAGVGGNVQLPPRPRYLHGSDRFFLDGALEGVQELGLKLAVIVRPLRHLVDVASLCTDVKNAEFPIK